MLADTSSSATAAADAPAPVVDTQHRALGLLSVGLLIAAFGPTMADLVKSWIDRAEYSHGFLMPPMAAWLLWERRRELMRLSPAPSALGVVLLVPCLALLLVGEMRLFSWIRAPALVAACGALTWSFYGGKGVRLILPALVVLALMCPLPARVELALTLPLKRIAALFATGMLDLTGIDASLDGNMIHLAGIDALWVADACSGIRSLISLFSLAVLACLVWERHWLLRLVVVASSVPVAVLVNGLRIWLTGYLASAVGPEAAEGFFHFFEGIALFGLATILLFLWAMLLSRAFARGE